MRAVDTNVVVRFLTGDDQRQAARARAVIGHEPVFISQSVVLETEWVLRAVYDLPPDRIIAALRALAGLPDMSIETAQSSPALWTGPMPASTSPTPSTWPLPPTAPPSLPSTNVLSAHHRQAPQP